MCASLSLSLCLCISHVLLKYTRMCGCCEKMIHAFLCTCATIPTAHRLRATVLGATYLLRKGFGNNAKDDMKVKEFRAEQTAMAAAVGYSFVSTSKAFHSILQHSMQFTRIKMEWCLAVRQEGFVQSKEGMAIYDLAQQWLNPVSFDS